MTEIITDLHAHGCTYYEGGVGEFIVRALGEGTKIKLEDFVSVCEEKFPNTSTLIGIVNFYTDTYEGILSNLKKFKGDIYDDYRDVFFGVKRKGKDIWRYFARVQEVPTSDCGHLLLIGADRNTNLRKTRDVLEEAKNETDALRIPSHVLMNYGLIGKVLSRGKKLSFEIDDLKKYEEDLDAVETGTSNRSKRVLKKIENFIEESGLNLPIIFSSDSHHPKKSLSSYTILHLNFEKDTKIRANLRQAIKNIKKEEKILGTNGRFQTLKHGLISIYNNQLRIPLDLLKPKSYI